MVDQRRAPVWIVAAEVLADPPDLPAPWTGRLGFDLPPAPWDLAPRSWACIGAVDDETHAIRALDALTRGVGLCLAIGLAGRSRQHFVEDLHKIGSVGPLDHGPLVGLGPIHRSLLDALAGGETLSAAAQRLHLSRRTANRRLVEARTALGQTSTAAAVSRWSTLPPPGSTEGPGRP